MRLLVAAACLTVGACRPFYRLAAVLESPATGWFVAGPEGETQVTFGATGEAACAHLDAGSAAGPLWLLVGDARDPRTDMARAAAQDLLARHPAGVFVYRWSRYAALDPLVDELALGINALAQCPRVADRPVFVVAHRAGGVLAARAAGRLRVATPEPSVPRLYLVTVAAPLAGLGLTESSYSGDEPAFSVLLNGVIPAYAPPTAGIFTLHLRSNPLHSANGHDPSPRGVGLPGAATRDLPRSLGADEALPWVTAALAEGRLTDVLDLPDDDEVATSDGQPRRARVCQRREEIVAAGEPFIVPAGKKVPADTPLWDGVELPAQPPDPSTYVRCRPCTCGAQGTLESLREWRELNTRAYERLRSARAVYPVAIIPGFHARGPVSTYRLAAGLELVQRGWAAALILSGGHRRGGFNEARAMLDKARELAASMKLDLEGRVFVEPCATRTITNLRNSLRMMAALGLRYGLLVTESKMTGQANVFYTGLETLVPQELRCPVGRVSFLSGDGPLPRMGEHDTGCQPPPTLLSNPVGFLFPIRRPSIFWVSPWSRDEGQLHSALECGGGSPKLTALEPDDEDPAAEGCLPVVGRDDFGCVRE